MALCLLAFTACAPASGTVSFYEALEDARKAGAVQRGWIPASIPDSARSIREAHNYDSREIWLHFTLPPGDLASMQEGCQEIGPMQVSWPRGTRQFSWWPPEIGQTPSQEAGPFRFYRCASQSRYPGRQADLPDFMATSADGTRVWYWRPS